ncbi:hypothetical protein M3Y98_00447900 [Aphelenchoides besseyi]|nr:hypothetical protein M3Y98_00447900 [Aphelenchoides besseyi]
MENTDFLLQLATVGVAMTGALATYIFQCGKNNKRGAVKKPAGSRCNKSLKTAKSKRSAKGGRWNNKSKRSARVSSRASARSAKKKLNPDAVQEGGSQQKKDITVKMATGVHIAPQQLRFEPSGGRMRVFVHNPKKERYALKVKCSDNNT